MLMKLGCLGVYCPTKDLQALEKCRHQHLMSRSIILRFLLGLTSTAAINYRFFASTVIQIRLALRTVTKTRFMLITITENGMDDICVFLFLISRRISP